MHDSRIGNPKFRNRKLDLGQTLTSPIYGFEISGFQCGNRAFSRSPISVFTVTPESARSGIRQCRLLPEAQRTREGSRGPWRG